MFHIKISEELKSRNPQMALGVLTCNVENSKFNESLWNEIENVSYKIREEYTLDTIKNNKQITATRNMYLACGKKPGRYRPAAEALIRRVVKGDKLYQINTLVDLVNLVSVRTGYSIGGFDADFINGNVIAGIGKKDEPYVGIGRGQLNIHNLPVLRDNIGAFGTPTSDEERTALREETTNFFMNINGYSGKEDLLPALEYTKTLLVKYVNAKNIIYRIIE